MAMAGYGRCPRSSLSKLIGVSLNFSNSVSEFGLTYHRDIQCRRRSALFDSELVVETRSRVPHDEGAIDSVSTSTCQHYHSSSHSPTCSPRVSAFPHVTVMNDFDSAYADSAAAPGLFLSKP